MKARQYVRPGKSGWDIIEGGHRRSNVQTRTKQAAIAEAHKLVRRQGGGEIRVLDSRGKVTASDTVSPSKARSSNQRPGKAA